MPPVVPAAADSPQRPARTAGDMLRLVYTGKFARALEHL